MKKPLASGRRRGGEAQSFRRTLEMPNDDSMDLCETLVCILRWSRGMEQYAGERAHWAEELLGLSVNFLYRRFEVSVTF